MWSKARQQGGVFLSQHIRSQPVSRELDTPPSSLPCIRVCPQAELATSHKCLHQEVKRLNEENQGLRAEHLPPSAPQGLEQHEGEDESLPSSVQVSRVWAPRALGPACGPFLSRQSRTSAWDPKGTGDRPWLLCLAALPWPTHLTSLRLSFLIWKNGT